MAPNIQVLFKLAKATGTRDCTWTCLTFEGGNEMMWGQNENDKDLIGDHMTHCDQIHENLLNDN